MSQKVLVLDSHSLIHRAYHALPPLETEKKERVNAVYGFFSILIKGIQDFNPNYIIAAFDFPAPTFRHQKFKEYKIKRPPTPEDLLPQFPKTKQALSALDIQVFEKKGFEADDIIGTISCILSNQLGVETVIMSGDKDNLQLINEKTKVYLLKRGIKEAFLFDVQKVKEEYGGLEPGQLIDYKGLKGDSSDNIPGIPGIGDKTATDLIKEFGSLDTLYQEIKKQTKKAKKINKKTEEKIIEFEKQAFLSRDLATIKIDVPINFDLKNCFWGGFKEKETKEAFEELGFYSLIKRVITKESSKNNLSLF